MRVARTAAIVLLALLAVGGLALAAWQAAELARAAAGWDAERGALARAVALVLGGAFASLLCGGALAAVLLWRRGGAAGPGAEPGREFDGVELEAVTFHDPELSEVYDSFRLLAHGLERNLDAVDAFRQRIDEEYARRDEAMAAERADAAALADSAREAGAEAGKFEVFKQLVKAFTSAPGPAEVLSFVIELSARMTGSGRASIMLVDKTRENLYLHKTLGWQPDAEKMKERVPLGAGFSGHVALENKRMLVTDVEAETGQGNKPEYKSKSFVILPVTSGKEVVGVLNLTDRPGGGIYEFDDLELLNLLLAQASLALENAMLRGKAFAP